MFLGKLRRARGYGRGSGPAPAAPERCAAVAVSARGGELFLELGDAGPGIVFGLGGVLRCPLLGFLHLSLRLLPGSDEGVVPLDQLGLDSPQPLFEVLDTRFGFLALPSQPLVALEHLLLRA